MYGLEWWTVDASTVHHSSPYIILYWRLCFNETGYLISANHLKNQYEYLPGMILVSLSLDKLWLTKSGAELSTGIEYISGYLAFK